MEAMDLAVVVGLIGAGFLLWYMVAAPTAELAMVPDTWHWPYYEPQTE